jgi:hypothetical protein
MAIIDAGVDETPLTPEDSVTVRLEMFGVEWVWTKPKAAYYYLQVAENRRSTVLELIDELEKGLPTETVELVKARLKDPDDALDTSHLIDVITRLREIAFKGSAERPTEPSSDSSQSPSDDGQN